MASERFITLIEPQRGPLHVQQRGVAGFDGENCIAVCGERFDPVYHAADLLSRLVEQFGLARMCVQCVKQFDD